jgi:hypothetical protein
MRFPILFTAIAMLTCAPQRPDPEIDERSYQLGVIGAFAEVVGAGVKKLALSSAMTPAEMDALIEEAEKIVARNGALSWREEDFLVTDLFPEEVTAGKHVLLIYLDPVKDEYFALKEEKVRLIAEGLYDGEARLEIARKMGRLLSYPESRIEKLLE